MLPDILECFELIYIKILLQLILLSVNQKTFSLSVTLIFLLSLLNAICRHVYTFFIHVAGVLQGSA